MSWLRSLLFNLWFFGLTAVLSVVGMVLLVAAPGRVEALARRWARWVLAGLRAICGIRVVVLGGANLPKDGPALLASRHQSAFDTLVWLTILPRCSYVLKRELLRIPVFGWLMRPGRQIAVDRDGGAAALRGLMREAAAAVAAGRQIVIFPEGTRADPGMLLPLQPGIAAIAARTGLPVIPVVTDSGRLWGRRAFRKRPGVIHIRLLPPLPPPDGRPGARGRLMVALAEALAEPADPCG
ncbi:MAG: lysophospholipid acyltransferase family protein [Acetobacteraceae bacterium]